MPNVVKPCGVVVWAGIRLHWAARVVCAKFGVGGSGVDLSRNELASCHIGWMGQAPVVAPYGGYNGCNSVGA